MKYKVGDKVLMKSYENIRSNPKADSLGKMARDWGGKVMTIKFAEINPHRKTEIYRMEEDYDYSAERKGWFWYEDMIEGLVNRIDISTDELLDFIGAQ